MRSSGEILSSIEQYERNIVHGKNKIEITETILDEMDTLLNEAQKWASTYGSGGVEANSAERRATLLFLVTSLARAKTIKANIPPSSGS